VNTSQVNVPGGTLYYQARGSGPALILSCGGPGNADTLAPLAGALQDTRTVITYDRRGYSRSRLNHPAGPATITTHADDLHRLITALGTGPATVFGTSFGALIALELAATAPASGQVLASTERQPFEVNLDTAPDPGAALNAIAASIGVKRGLTGEGPAIQLRDRQADGPGDLKADGPVDGQAGGLGGGPGGEPGASAPRPADVELFIRRDVPAIGDYHLDLDRLASMAGRIIVTGSEEGRGFYPYQCAQKLAEYLGTALVELPGNHAGMIQHPEVFADRLRGLLGARIT
jgi:pimeloyl-ACP methyl ester carboxylesterase